MTDKLTELKRKRDQLTARIQQQEARLRATEKKAEDRVKVLVGAMLLDQIKRQGGQGGEQLLARMGEFLVRPAERQAVLGADGQGSDAMRRLLGLIP